MNQFNKVTLAQMRVELNNVLKAYGDIAGVDFSLGNITFAPSEFHVKLTSKIRGAKTMADSTLECFMSLNKLKKDGIGGRVLTGYNSRAKTMPFMYTRGGKSFKCSVSVAKQYFGV